MRIALLVLLLSMLLPQAGYAQEPLSLAGVKRNCGTEPYREELKQRYPEFRRNEIQIEQAVQQLTQSKQGQYLRQATITIPVVFHVLYNSASENISDEQVLSQLEILNADFRRKNADASNTPSYFQGVAADTEIEFCLASLNPNGDPSTGITRTQTNKSSFDYLTDEMKYSSRGGVDAWDRNQYLNIWVCRISDNVLGYAAPPGTPEKADGVVLHYATVGAPPYNTFNWNYNKGRTATHEVGHWLGLRHIWGNGSSCTDSDGIDDTPNQFEENVGCPEGNKVSCDNGPYGDMYQNYMDYTDDACMNLFTMGQAARMKAILATTRGSLYNSLACTATLRSDFNTSLVGDTLTVAGQSVKFSDASVGVRPTSYFWEFEGGVPATSTEKNPVVQYTVPGKYDVKLTISNGSLTSTETKPNYVNVTVTDLVVYPNPTSDYIIVEQPARVMVKEVRLVNFVGQQVATAKAYDRFLRVDVKALPAGVYFLYVTSTKGTIIKKISIVR